VSAINFAEINQIVVEIPCLNRLHTNRQTDTHTDITKDVINYHSTADKNKKPVHVQLTAGVQEDSI